MSKKPTTKKETNIKVGNISGVNGGAINIAGGNITTHTTTNTSGLSAADIKQLFEGLQTKIEADPKTSPADKEDIKDEVNKIRTKVAEAASKNEKLDESFLARRFANIARMGPDILDVVVATLGNPLAGLGVAVKKIAAKAKEETQGS
jgi:hypothetical protein